MSTMFDICGVCGRHRGVHVNHDSECPGHFKEDSEDFGGETDIGYEPSPPRRPGPTQPPASYVNPFGWSGPPTPEPATPSPPPLTVAEAFQHALWCSYWAGVHSGATGETARERFEAWYRKDVLS